jgi:hypothetical protein
MPNDPAAFKPLGFEDFIISNQQSLQRIARSTPDRLSTGDLEGEAYLAACEAGNQRGVAVDLRQEDQRQWLLGRLYNRCVKLLRSRWGDARLDHPPRGAQAEDGSLSPLRDRLEAPACCEPLTHLLEAEEQRLARDSTRQVGYSELLAYGALLSRFGPSLKQLASHLAISTQTLRRRIRRASARANLQMPLFTSDGLDESFLIRPAGRSQPSPASKCRQPHAANTWQQLNLLS